MKLTCAIIDDEPLAASLLESYALKTPFLELKGKYNSALNAMDALHNEPVQVLFLDIQMPELSGMEFSKMLPPETKVILRQPSNSMLSTVIGSMPWIIC